MGQRSQIYCIVKKDNDYTLTADYFQWNYGERMLSRVKGTLENIIDKYLKYPYLLTDKYEHKKVIAPLMAINWDMHDIAKYSDIVQEFTEDIGCWHSKGNTLAKDFRESVFGGQDNNDGQAYIYVDLNDKENPVKIGFTKYDYEPGVEVYDANRYLLENLSGDKPWQDYMRESEYYDIDTIKYTSANIDYIKEHSSQLTSQELEQIVQDVSVQFERDYLEQSFPHGIVTEVALNKENKATGVVIRPASELEKVAGEYSKTSQDGETTLHTKHFEHLSDAINNAMEKCPHNVILPEEFPAYYKERTQEKVEELQKSEPSKKALALNIER